MKTDIYAIYQTTRLPAQNSDGEMHRVPWGLKGGTLSHSSRESRAGFPEETLPVLGQVSQLIPQATRQSEQRHGDKTQGRVSQHPKEVRMTGITSGVAKVRSRK